MNRNRVAIALILAVFIGAGPAKAESAGAAWAALKQGGHVVVMRHSLDEPGNGDPPGHRFGVCETERQLIPEGREKARRIGEAFRSRGIVIGEVMSSQWCRAKHTAEIAFGRYTVWTALNVLNPNTNPHIDREAQTAAALARIAAHSSADTLVLVTHFYNIMPMLGTSPAKGDMLVVRPGKDSAKPTIVGHLRLE